jgi:hypothetical protein
MQIFDIRPKDPGHTVTMLKKGIEAGERGVVDAKGPGR